MFLFLLIISGFAEQNAILLSEIKTLHLDPTKFTSFHRTEAIPQAKCFQDETTAFCSLFTPSSFTCNNISPQSSRPVWDCSATLPSWLKLGSAAVSCEGFRQPDDPYVTKGSCGLVYSFQWRSEALDISQPPPAEIDSVFLPDVEEIIFSAHSFTSHNSQSQLNCLKDCPPPNFLPTLAISRRNRLVDSDPELVGSDEWIVEIQDSDNHLMLSSSVVVCPGLRSKKDDWITSVSDCQLFYTLQNPSEFLNLQIQQTNKLRESKIPSDQVNAIPSVHIPVLLGYHVKSLFFQKNEKNSLLLRNQQPQDQTHCVSRKFKNPLNWNPEIHSDEDQDKVIQDVKWEWKIQNHCPDVPESISCKSDSTSVGRISTSWRCYANGLPSYVTIQNVQINCQGSNNDEDEWTDPRTCFVEYSILDNREPWNPNANSSSSFIGYLVLSIIAFIFLGPLIYSICLKQKKINKNSKTSSKSTTDVQEPSVLDGKSKITASTLKTDSGKGIQNIKTHGVAFHHQR